MTTTSSIRSTSTMGFGAKHLSRPQIAIMDDGEEKKASKRSSRFAKPETMENLQQIVDGAESAKTRNQTDWAVRTWKS